MGATVTDPTPGFLDQSAARDALDRVLKSGIFDRAPNLGLMLRYVCAKHFDGRAEEIKEYNIAVDALGRPPDFDQKRDSIVRVEAHRLRKRLAEYYARAGTEDPVEIQIPSGTYVPRFVVRRPELLRAAPFVAEPSIETPPAVLIIQPAPAIPWRRASLAAVLILTAATAVVLRSRATPAADGTAIKVAISPLPASATAGPELPANEIRILAGSTQERTVDHLGNVWVADRYVTGGEIRESPTRPINRTLDDPLYLRRREGDFRYDIPVLPGIYEVRLHFAETVFGDGNVAGGGESSRVFALYVNDQPRPEAVDVLSNAGGPNTSWIRVLRNVRPKDDGKIHIRFAPFVKEQPFVNGIEIVPASQSGMQPIRVVARSTPFTDGQKQVWVPDQYFSGGVYVQRHEAVAGATDAELFQGERYGNFTYAFPVDPGSHYTVTLRFAESWFGPGRPGGGGSGSRLFDVYSGGRTLLHRFDIYKEAGGALRAVVKTFRGLEPTAQGRLILEFVPVENYALINSIEVVDEGR